MATIELSGTDTAIIGELREGRNLPANIAESIESDRHYVQRRLKWLREHNIVTNIGHGVYELTETDPDGKCDVMKSFVDILPRLKSWDSHAQGADLGWLRLPADGHDGRPVSLGRVQPL